MAAVRGFDLEVGSGEVVGRLRAGISMVFQDPAAALNPVMRLKTFSGLSN